MRLYRREPSLSLVNPWLIMRNLWRHRALIRQFAWRGVELRHKGSFLGMIWAFLNPLLVLAVYAFVFVCVFDSHFGSSAKESRWDYAIAIFLGLSLIQLFLETLSVAPTVIVSNPNYVKKVVFPLEVLPISALGASLFHCVVSLGLVLLAIQFLGGGLSASVLWLPVVLLPVLLLSSGAAWLMASLGVFIRDLSFVTQFLSLVLMFLSAVFYPASRIPEAFSVLRLNPLLIALESSRNAVLWHQAPQFTQLAYLYTVGAMGCLSGHFLFAKLKPAFADVI